jgi:hypothetical protein
MVKIIFLDVDGVLNKAETQGSFEETCVLKLKEIMDQTGAKIVLSSTWRGSPNTYTSLAKKLIEYNIVPSMSEAFIGHTPLMNCVHDQGMPLFFGGNSHIYRPDEILLWLKCNAVSPGKTREDYHMEQYFPLHPIVKTTDELYQHGERWSKLSSWILDQPVEIEQFVAIDDMNLLVNSCYASALQDHFVRTTLKFALDEEATQQVISILQAPFDYDSWRQQVFRPCSNEQCQHATADVTLNEVAGTAKQSTFKRVFRGFFKS